MALLGLCDILGTSYMHSDFCQKVFCCCCFSVIDVYQVVGKGQNIAQTEVTMADEFAKISDKHVLKF